jgi:hypothetical protein
VCVFHKTKRIMAKRQRTDAGAPASPDTWIHIMTFLDWRANLRLFGVNRALQALSHRHPIRQLDLIRYPRPFIFRNERYLRGFQTSINRIGQQLRSLTLRQPTALVGCDRMARLEHLELCTRATDFHALVSSICDPSRLQSLSLPIPTATPDPNPTRIRSLLPACTTLREFSLIADECSEKSLQTLFGVLPATLQHFRLHVDSLSFSNSDLQTLMSQCPHLDSIDWRLCTVPSGLARILGHDRPWRNVSIRLPDTNDVSAIQLALARACRPTNTFCVLGARVFNNEDALLGVMDALGPTACGSLTTFGWDFAPDDHVGKAIVALAKHFPRLRAFVQSTFSTSFRPHVALRDVTRAFQEGAGPWLWNEMPPFGGNHDGGSPCFFVLQSPNVTRTCDQLEWFAFLKQHVVTQQHFHASSGIGPLSTLTNAQRNELLCLGRSWVTIRQDEIGMGVLTETTMAHLAQLDNLRTLQWYAPCETSWPTLQRLLLNHRLRELRLGSHNSCGYQLPVLRVDSAELVDTLLQCRIMHVSLLHIAVSGITMEQWKTVATTNRSPGGTLQLVVGVADFDYQSSLEMVDVFRFGTNEPLLPDMCLGPCTHLQLLFLTPSSDPN